MAAGQDGPVLLMGVLGVLLLAGIALTVWWGGTAYRPWERAEDGSSVKGAALRYGRGVAVAIVGGFWAGTLVTGPAMRLIMRLLAVTAGDEAQGAITEAEEVVGAINFDGTLGLWIFGGVLPGLLSGAIYVLVRRWLPGGRLAGVVFGALHLIVAATRVDPLRPDNPDFDIVGPGWLSVLTLGLAAVFHGMAVAAIANRYSTRFPPAAAGRRVWVRALLPLALPALLVLLLVFALIPLLVGLIVAVVASQVGPLTRAMRSRAAVVTGRVVLALLALLLLPSAVFDLRDVILR